MNSNIFEQLEVLDTKTLSTIEGGGYGAQCVVGTVGSVILGGALFGPFGAGAMMFVVVEELIPESQTNGNTDVATLGLMVGFVIMMVMDVALG
jgi:zinc transporter ZupT